MILFGVMYDAGSIRLVAHMPFVDSASDGSDQWSYLSCVVDTLPFNPLPLDLTPPDLQAWCAGRFKVALALLSLWDGITWPAAIALSEAMHESEYLEPTAPPSDRLSVDFSDHLFDYEDSNDSNESPTTSGDQEFQKLEMEELEKKTEKCRPVVERWVVNVDAASADGTTDTR
ncbi:hypothetical protein BKA93DRAFT_931541 [Sparassis latifolia]|uniref:Uncharacterized protein n=1 Tax=Sparassis crispa TaxID=139825 RepID=A0A401GQD3_9APHY|nr:hypothetical protein SCP_0603380 [Sparassis crispa]GBE84359.1 hypothetical protein SCP_0603380 [Sparassis crispa]